MLYTSIHFFSILNSNTLQQKSKQNSVTGQDFDMSVIESIKINLKKI